MTSRWTWSRGRDKAAQTAAKDRYNRKAYDQVKISVRKGGRDVIHELAAAAGLSVAEYIRHCIIADAKQRGIDHEERHSTVEYVVAHGISSTVEGERVLIGSHHFIIEDEQCTPPDERIFRHLPKEYSHLYLAIGGEVAAVICIEDPLRKEAADVISKLHEYGISKVVMMTGDNERTARAVAEKVGIDECRGTSRR